MANTDLGAAKKAKQDEFYTQWADIEKEMNAYLEFDADVFRDKVVLLPCDDPEWSNFTKFFALHFQDFGLKKLISTSYAPNSNAGAQFYEPTLRSILLASCAITSRRCGRDGIRTSCWKHSRSASTWCVITEIVRSTTSSTTRRTATISATTAATMSRSVRPWVSKRSQDRPATGHGTSSSTRANRSPMAVSRQPNTTNSTPTPSSAGAPTVVMLDVSNPRISGDRRIHAA